MLRNTPRNCTRADGHARAEPVAAAVLFRFIVSGAAFPQVSAGGAARSSHDMTTC
jgi:hypothetical protein